MNKLKYPLTDQEKNKLDDAWNFLEIFKQNFIFISDYRSFVIKEVNKKYKLEEFYFFENIINKLFWNLRFKLYLLWMNENITKKEYEKNMKDLNVNVLPYALTLCEKKIYGNDNELKKLLKHNNVIDKSYYRSFINKLIIVDKEHKTVWLKKMEGSSDIFSKNYFNLYTFSILFDRQLYEKIIEDPFIIRDKTIKQPNFYYQYDYAFPNLNFCSYSIGSKEDKIDRIKKMYYSESDTRARNWFKIII